MKKSLLHIFLMAAALVLAACEPEDIPGTGNDEILSVTLDYDGFDLPYGVEVSGGFTVKNADRTVTLNAVGLPSGIEFRSDVGNGRFYLTSMLEEEACIDARLEFSDSDDTVTRDIVIHTFYNTPVADVKAPENMDLTASLDCVYPYPAEYEIMVDYAVTGEDPIDRLVVESEGLAVRTVSESEDRMSGCLAVKATQNLGPSAVLTVTAGNAAGEVTRSLTFHRAYITVDVASAEAPAEPYKPLEIHVNSNVPYGVTAVGLDFARVTIDAGTIVVEMPNNTELKPRGGEIVVSDDNDVLVERIPVTQKAAVANNDTDRAALMAIYDALNMKEWTDYGSFGTYYANWGTDVPMDKWLGLNWTDWDGKGRLWYLHLTGNQPNSTGYIPEELGNLTELRDFAIYPNHKITHLPESIRNLTKLEELAFLGDDMEHIDISEWTGLADLMNNPKHKLWSICFSRSKIHGSIPEWVANIEDKGAFDVNDCHFSGQVPDAVAKSANWNHKFAFNDYEVECYPRFKDGMFEKKYKSDGSYYYEISIGDYNILTQADNYALWIGERPENTRWVDDNLGGHWEWTD